MRCLPPAFAVSLMIGGCSPGEIGVNPDEAVPPPTGVAVYASSEGGDQAYLINKRTESFGTSNVWRRGEYPELYDFTLVIYRRAGFYYESQFLLAVPFDRAADRWGDEDITCVARRPNGANVKAVECRFKREDKVSRFEFDPQRGIVSFEADCVVRVGRCTLRLVEGDGLFDAGFKFIEEQDREPDGTISID